MRIPPPFGAKVFASNLAMVDVAFCCKSSLMGSGMQPLRLLDVAAFVRLWTFLFPRLVPVFIVKEFPM